jgi:hypothetical protein
MPSSGLLYVSPSMNISKNGIWKKIRIVKFSAKAFIILPFQGVVFGFGIIPQSLAPC